MILSTFHRAFNGLKIIDCTVKSSHKKIHKILDQLASTKSIDLSKCYLKSKVSIHIKGNVDNE